VRDEGARRLLHLHAVRTTPVISVRVKRLFFRARWRRPGGTAAQAPSTCGVVAGQGGTLLPSIAFSLGLASSLSLLARNPECGSGKNGSLHARLLHSETLEQKHVSDHQNADSRRAAALRRALTLPAPCSAARTERMRTRAVPRLRRLTLPGGQHREAQSHGLCVARVCACVRV